MEKRNISTSKVLQKENPLPIDFIRMVSRVFEQNFEEGLKALAKFKGKKVHIEASGGIYPDEVLLAVSIITAGELAATTVFASHDFDPKASSPSAQDILGACVDAIGSLFQQIFFDEKIDKGIEKLAAPTLSAVEGVPFEWTELEVDRYRVYLKVDKSNPSIESMADLFLEKNDPEYKERLQKEHEETEKLFVTGPKKSSDVH
jgi:hypothetical protein